MKIYLKNYLFLGFQLISFISIFIYSIISDYYPYPASREPEYNFYVIYEWFPLISLGLWLLWILFNLNDDDSLIKRINFLSLFIFINLLFSISNSIKFSNLIMLTPHFLISIFIIPFILAKRDIFRLKFTYVSYSILIFIFTLICYIYSCFIYAFSGYSV